MGRFGNINYAERHNSIQFDGWIEALLMWRAGQDTADIAAHFNVTEAQIYNGLPAYRAQSKRIAA